MQNFGYIIGGLAVVLIILGVLFWQSSEPAQGEYDAFAQCLTDEGVKMYGAFWCSHCQEQKELFGASWRHVEYVECSTPDSQGQLQVCQDENITSYPTWEFPDGSRLTGVMRLEELADETSCSLDGTDGSEQPAEENTTATTTNNSETETEEGMALQMCPDEWIDNQMPMVGEVTEERQYFIVDGERRELAEFDMEWVEANCDIEPQVVQ